MLAWKVFYECVKRPIYLYNIIGLIILFSQESASPYVYEIFLVPLVCFILFSIGKDYFINYYRFWLD